MGVEIKPYNNELKRLFSSEKERLCNYLGPSVVIEHVGSSAVEIGGKNIVDILIGVEDYREGLEIGRKLLSVGYHAGAFVDTGRIFMASRDSKTKEGDFHLHICNKDSDEYHNFILLRDYLRAHSEEARRYYEKKKEFAKQAKSDRKEYKRIKSEYVDELLRRARLWDAERHVSN